MSVTAERILTQYRDGRVTRRDLIASLVAFLGASHGLHARQGPSSIAVRTLNHVTLTVTDVQRSVAFYQRLFGLRVQTDQGTEADWSAPAVPVLAIGSGPQFIAFGRGTTPSINHFCLGMDGFEVDRVGQTLASHGLKGRVRMREGAVPELMFPDPDNLAVQIQDVRYCGGSGPLGEQCDPRARPRKSQPTWSQPQSEPIAVRTLNHVTLTVSDPKRSVEFYQRVFGLRVQALQGSTVLLGLGGGPAFIAFGGGGSAKPSINHFCLGVEGFDVDRIMKTLEKLGVQGRVRIRGEAQGGGPEGCPELYFNDPDNISVQLQDASYCGGSGRLGNVCRA